MNSCSRVLLPIWACTSFVKKEGKKEKKSDRVCSCSKKMAAKVVVASSCFAGKCTSVLVETEKNAHSQSNAVSFAVTIFLSALTGSELRLLKNLSQSVSQSGED